MLSLAGTIQRLFWLLTPFQPPIPMVMLSTLMTSQNCPTEVISSKYYFPRLSTISVFLPHYCSLNLFPFLSLCNILYFFPSSLLHSHDWLLQLLVNIVKFSDPWSLYFTHQVKSNPYCNSDFIHWLLWAGREKSQSVPDWHITNLGFLNSPRFSTI
jgi:hypothetical protein